MSRYTEQILQMVQKPGGHLTAEKIYEKMKKENPGIVLATVYNNLAHLTEKGLVRRIHVEGQPDRYDRTLRHDHLVCAGCGALSDVFLDDITSVLEEKTGQKLISYDLQLNYLCPRCRAAKEEK